MRIVGMGRLEAGWIRHPDLKEPLQKWITVVGGAAWKHPRHMREMLPSADLLDLGHRTVVIFNVKGNAYRLIANVDFSRQVVNILLLLTHAEYDKEKWKGTL